MAGTSDADRLAQFVSLCEWMSEGKPLVEWSRQPGNAHFSQIYRWMAANAELKSMYDEARRIGADMIADQLIGIADNDVDTTGAVARDRLRIEARQWLLERWSGKYSSRRTVELTGAEGGPISTVRREIIDAGK